MEKLSPERLVYLISLGVLAVAGLGVIAIGTVTATEQTGFVNQLASGLWKHDFTDYVQYRKEKVWAWRKLSLTGLMVSSLLVSFTIKWMDLKHCLSFSIGSYVVWMLFLCYYWYAVVLHIPGISGPKKAVEETEGVVGNSKADGRQVAAAAGGWAAKYKSKESTGMNATDSTSSAEIQDTRLPVSIITGFLGSGKTTLVQNILHNTVGMRILVIENEIGAEGIDHDLLIPHTAVKEDIVLMNNGCICCTVRQDLLTTFKRIMSNDAFAMLDWVIIETTGLADPAPVVQTLYMDAECQKRLRLDGVIAVVDAKHIPHHMSTLPSASTTSSAEHLANSTAKNKNVPVIKVSGPVPVPISGWASASSPGAHGGLPEAVLQVSLADRILVNKTDLIDESELFRVQQLISSINPTAVQLPCQRSDVSLDNLLNIKAFDPAKNSALLSEEALREPTKPIFMIRTDKDGKIVTENKKKSKQPLNSKSREHVKEKEMQRDAAATISNSKEGNSYGVTTVSIITSDPLDLNRFNMWISSLMQSEGNNIYRMKGILQMKGYDQKFVAHGIHMIFDGQLTGSWAADQAQGLSVQSRIVFIGLKLNAVELEKQFSQCVFKKKETD